MSEAITFLAAPFVMCLFITAIHVYLGLHILERGVIFVDLSLAQVAALGATVAVVFGAEEHGLGAHAAAMGFTAVGAAIFAFTRRARKKVSQEALVGVVYAVASAVTVLVLSGAPHGGDHIKDTLVGTLLLTDWDVVLRDFFAYTLIGLAELALAKRFIQISWHPDQAEAELSHVEWWDLLFYLLFGLVVTISVQVAGILVVFSYLIVPAVITSMFWKRIPIRLGAGWLIAVAASVVGLATSWAWDLPTGATVVATFGGFLLLAGAIRAVAK
ncbi:MAG: metal ABC transporter permease [Myxococcota bacterium]